MTTNAKPYNGLYRADSILTSMGASAVASAMSRLIGLVRNVALAWLIPQSQFGLFGVAVLVINILLPLCSAGLYEGVMRYAPYHEARGTLRGFVRRSFFVLLLVVVAVSSALWVFAEPVSQLLFSSASPGLGAASEAGVVTDLVRLLRWTVLCVAALAVFHTLQGFFKGLHMFRLFGAAEVVSALIFTILALAGAWWGMGNADMLVLAYTAACVIGVIAFAPGWVSQLRTNEINKLSNAQAQASVVGRSPEIKRSGYLMTYSLWAAGTAVLWHAMSYYPMWYLLKVSDGETVGSFHAVRLIAQVIQLGAVILTGVVAANVTRLWEHQGRQEAIERLSLLTRAALAVMVLAAGGLLLAQPLAIRLFPSSFEDGSAAYAPMVLSFLLVGVVGLLAVRLTVLEKPRLVCLSWCVGAIVTIVASMYWIRPIGESDRSQLVSASWASVAGVFCAMVSCLILVRLKGLGLDRRSAVLILVCFGCGFGGLYAIGVLVVLFLLVLTPRAIFSKSEWMSLRLALRNQVGS